MAKVRSVTPQPIRYLLNSHHHSDHIGGNGAILDLGIEIIAHKNIREIVINEECILKKEAPLIVYEKQAETA